MTTINDITQAVGTWVQTVSGRVTIAQNDGGPRPSTPYATFHIQSLGGYHHPLVTFDETGEVETINSLTRIAVDVTCWGGDDCEQVAQKLRASLFASARHTDLWALMGMSEVGDVIDMTDFINASTRARNEFRFFAYTNLVNNFASDYFNTITIDGKLVGTDVPPHPPCEGE